ncbi:MAG: class I SAM-dependent rRNA methyltransferase [Chloroflexi bacterium]|nr:MAG: class I SAM-dependent rRNA methyltransferase [Chloroflexota bacterium]
MTTTTGEIILKPGREKPVRNRHPWIFSGAIQQVRGKPKTGDIVEVLDKNGRFLARAYYNPHSQIRARILTWTSNEPIDPTFWEHRIKQAITARQLLALEPATTAYRLIHAEADGLPGLIVDKYANYLVIQCLTAGIDRYKQTIIEILANLLHPTGIIERSDVDVRRKEGLEPVSSIVWGNKPPELFVVQENGFLMQANLLTGHKTGLYLDQRENRTAVCQPHHVSHKEILNVFAYTGGFALYAAAHHPTTIVNLDSSATALQEAHQNLQLNNLHRPQDEYITGDAFEILRYYRDTNRQFDMVILDPPKFAHTQRDIERACRGYKDLNWLAFRILRPGGLLATFSCSGLISADLFQKVVFGALVDAGREAQIIQTLGQASDHPISLTFPESAYLKGLLCRVW